MTLQANNTLLSQNDSLGSHCKSWHLQSSPISLTVGHGLQNSPYFWVVKYMRTVKQKVWSEAVFFSLTHMPCVNVRLAGFVCERLWCYARASLLKKKILRKSLSVLRYKLVSFFSFRLRSLANGWKNPNPPPPPNRVDLSQPLASASHVKKRLTVNAVYTVS